MKLIYSYYKLVLYDILVVLITAFCSIIILSSNLVVLGISKYVIFQCLAPIFPGLLLVVLDVVYIIVYVDMKEIYLEKNIVVRRGEITKIAKMQKVIINLLYFTSFDVILLGMILIVGLILGKFPISIIESIISYCSLIVLAIYHLIVLKRKL